MQLKSIFTEESERTYLTEVSQSTVEYFFHYASNSVNGLILTKLNIH